MRLNNFYFVLIVLFNAAILTAGNNPFPSINVKTLDGKSVNTNEFTSNGKITIVSFWATWCTPCKRQLDLINEVYAEWSEKYNLQLLAITIDDARGLTKVPSMVKSKGWEFTVLLDNKQELMQALNFPAVPHTFLLNAKGEIVYDHSGYNSGDEIELEKKIAELMTK